MRSAQLSTGGDDRCLVERRGERLILGVADGAGGTGGAAEAAATVMEWLREKIDVLDPGELLYQCDRAMAGIGGESTAVIAVVDANGVRGASVGDSGAWVIEPSDRLVDLCENQTRKPFIGSGRATPVAFSAGPLTGTLLVASDGLFKYASAELIRRVAVEADFERIPEALVAAVRLPSGRLQDDVTVVVCRP